MDFIIKGQVKKFLQPLKNSGVRLMMTALKGERVVIARNYPSNYKALFMESLNALESFGVKISTGKYKGEPCLIFKNLPKDYLGIISEVVNNY